MIAKAASFPALSFLAATTALIALIAPTEAGYTQTSSSNAPDAAAATAYQDNCAACHGKSLSGGSFGPSLKDEKFLAKWKPQSAAALRDFIIASMPPGGGGSLDRATYVQATAHILRANGMAAGGLETAQAAASAAPAASRPQEPVEGSGKLNEGTVSQDRFYHEVMDRRSARLNTVRPVPEAELRNPSPADWLSARRTDDGQAFSPLDQINRANARSLEMAWTLALPPGNNEITPIVRDGVMFVNSRGTILALDVATGEQLWKFARATDVKWPGPPTSQPRGIAIFEDRIFAPTLDGHIIALDMRTGKLVWDHAVAGMENWMRFSAAPLVVRGKVIQGSSGCWNAGKGSKCFIVALDTKNGNEAWRINTVAEAGQPGGDSWNGAPAEKRSGASIWAGASYDAGTNLIYIGTGNTYHTTPLLQPNAARSAKNAGLYTNSTLAFDADTGKIAWTYQHLARDVWDLDWAFERIVATLPVAGKSRRVVMTMGKLGILDVLDAKTGKYLFSHDLGHQSLVTAIDPKTGWKTTDPAADPTPNKAQFICPYALGVRNWPAMSYNPTSHHLYVGASTNVCMNFTWTPGEDSDFSLRSEPQPNNDGLSGEVDAIDLTTNKRAWTQKHRAQPISSMLATAGGLVFEGGRDREFRASNDDTGEILWSAKLENVPNASPITFSAGGVQYVAVTTGGGATNEALRGFTTPEIEPTGVSSLLWVFRLRPEK